MLKLQDLLKSKYGIYIAVIFSVILGILVTGYRVGIHDQGLYIPLIKYLLNPNLYPGDELLEFAGANTTVIWFLFLPVFRILGIGITLTLLHILSLGLYAFSGYKITQHLTNDKLLAFLGAVTFALPKFGLGGTSTFGNYFAPRELAAGLLLVAIYLVMRKSKLAAVAVAGFAAIINMATAGPIFGLLLLYLLVFPDFKITKEKIVYVVIGLGMLIPLVLWRSTGSSDGISLGINYDWIEFLRLNMPAFFDRLRSASVPELLLDASLLFSYCYLIYVSLKKLKISKPIKQLFGFLFVGIVAAVLVNYLLLEFFPITAIMQLQLIRLGYFLPFLVYPLLLAGATSLSELSAAVTGLAPISVLIDLYKKQISKVNWLNYGLFAIIAVLSGFFVFINIKATHIEITKANTAENDIQTWMLLNTPVDAKFITPTYLNEIEVVSFRVFSERSIVFANAEIGMVALSEGIQSGVTTRMNDLSNGNYDQYAANNTVGSYGKLFEQLYAGYLELDAQGFTKLGDKYEADYIIVEQAQDLDLPIVYQNNKYKIYDLNHN